MEQHHLNVPGGQVTLFTDPYLGYDSHYLFDILYQEVPWEQRHVQIYGVERAEPRLTQWYGDHGYTYSGNVWLPRPWDPLLDTLRYKMQELTGAYFNGVLLNLYENGQSSIGMHSDNEPEFGPCPTIASLSLGSERWFNLQRKDKSLPTIKTLLPHGSVLVMSGHTQELWKHGIDKTKESVGPRINLTFRNIIFPR